MKAFFNDANVSLQGEELFDEIYDAFKNGVTVGMEEANYLLIKKLAGLNINLTLISELTNTSIEDVISIANDRYLDVDFSQY